MNAYEHNPPPGVQQLLGLGPKFIPPWTYPRPNLLHTLQHFAREIRLKYTFAGTTSQPISKNARKIYIKSDWTPPYGNDDLKAHLKNYQNLTTVLVSANCNSISITRNLNRIQYNTIHRLKNNPHIIVLLANKNLGPVLMDRSEYISCVISDHLSDSTTYQQLTKSEALKHLDDIKDQLEFTFEHPNFHTQNQLSDNDQKYFSRALHQPTYCLPTFYGLVKIHKKLWTLLLVFDFLVQILRVSWKYLGF